MKKFYIILIAMLFVNGAIAQWFPQNSGTTNNLYEVYFTDANTGYVVGENGTILKTTNGGLPVSINDEPLTTESIKIFPNPSSTQITISTPTTPEKSTTLTICNFDGQQLITQQVSKEITTVDVSGLSQGIYIVKVKDDRTVQVGKFIKDR